jgi:hypothetical protein
MSKVIFGIFLILCSIISSIFLRIITIENWKNDCMIQYILSNQKSWYIYKLDSFKYHIDTEDYDFIEKIWVSKGCSMITYDSKMYFVAITNSIYCSIVSIVV